MVKHKKGKKRRSIEEESVERIAFWPGKRATNGKRRTDSHSVFKREKETRKKGKK